jgi:hypothetical protein
MARKKLEAFEKAGQSYYIIAEVKDASKEEKTSKAGKPYTEYKARVRTPEGVTIFVKSTRFPATDEYPEHSFKTEGFTNWDEMIETEYNDVKRGFVFIKGNKKAEKKMYNWLTNYEKEDGQISYNLDNFPQELDFAIGEDEEVVINFKSGASKFKERKTTFTATMYVGDIDGNRLLLTDGKEDYPNTLTVELDEGMENKAKIGQGYTFRLKLAKGKRAKVESGTTNWGDEGTTTDYEPDKLIVEAVESMVKDMTLGKVVKSKAKKTTTTTVENDEDDMPF